MARADRVSRLIDTLRARAELATRIERQFREWGNVQCAEIAAAMAREIAWCRQALQAANYPLDPPGVLPDEPSAP